MQILTKSKYLIGIQCPKYLWITFHEKEKIPKASIADEFKFKEGEKVGELAKKLFPDGIDLSSYNFKENIDKTKEAIKAKKPLFEAGFLVDNCFSRADILVPDGNKWDIIEVKSGTKVKDVNVQDVSFQKYVYEKCGLKIKNCFLMHINKEFIRNGEINVKELFEKENITSEVKAISDVEDNIQKLFEIILSDKAPEIAVGAHCKDPYTCPICECWEHLPENHVFCLYRGGKISCELYENGVESIKNITGSCISKIKLYKKSCR